MDLPDTIERFLTNAPAEARALHERILALGMAGAYAKYLADAGSDAISAFFEDLARVDLSRVARHKAALTGLAKEQVLDLQPIEPDIITPSRRLEFEKVGQESLARGEWAVLVFAGGASTRFYAEAQTHPLARGLVARLGSEPPKGLFPIAPVSGLSFLDIFASEALASGVESGRMPYFIVMVSDVTKAPVQQWLQTSHLWGLPKECVIILEQGVHPRLDLDGDLVVGPEGRLLWTGDGHGGVYAALLAPGADGPPLAHLLWERGVRGVVMHNVDNALARALDLARIGFHVATGARMTVSVVRRTRIDEKVGLVGFNPVADRIEVVEYSVCPRTLAEAVDPDGLPRFWLSHICTNLVALDAVRGDLPPTLYVGKEVKIGGRHVITSTFETLSQHLSSLLDPSEVRVLLLDREEFFLPTKTVTGPASYEATVAGLAARGRRLLREAGAHVEDTALVEVMQFLPPLGRAGGGVGWAVGRNARVFLGVRHGLDGALPLSEGLDVGDGATLWLEAERPYGLLQVDSTSRLTREDPSSAGRIRVGRGVRLGPGAALEVVLVGNATLVIEDGAIVSGRVRARVPPGESWTLLQDGTICRRTGE